MKKPSSTSIFTLQDLEKKQKILEKKSFLQNLKDQKAKQIEQRKSKISEKISSEKSEADTSTTSSTVSTQENDFSLSTSRSNNTSTTPVDDIDILAQNLGLQRTDNPTISFLLRQLATNRARQADNAYITNGFLARARQSDFQFEQHISSLQDHLAAAQSGFDALQTIQNTSTNRVFWIATAVGGLSFVLFLANRYFSSHNNTSVPTTVSTGAITINPPNIILPPVVQVGPSPSPFSARVLEFSLIALGVGLVSFFRKK